MHFWGRKHLKQQEGNCFNILNEQHCMNPKSFQAVSREVAIRVWLQASVTDKAQSNTAKPAVNAPAI